MVLRDVVEFPTGGESPRALGQTRWKSGADGESPDGRRPVFRTHWNFSRAFFILKKVLRRGLMEKTIMESELSELEIDEKYMSHALELAEKGRGTTHPNPMVGAVIVSGGIIAGEGYHRAPGEPHAEVVAIENAREKARGSTLYVTLEPCAHSGRTPPCVDAIARAGIRKVVFAMRDPNPCVLGGGGRILSERGIIVKEGVLEERAQKLNEEYVKRVTAGIPFVTLKMAMTLDGKVASKDSSSRFISSEESRRDVHSMRGIADAIIVGIGTVLADNPLLTVRMGVKPRRIPARVVVDSHARIPTWARVLDTSEARTIVAVSREAPVERIRMLKSRGIEVIENCGKEHVDLRRLLEVLGEMGMTSVILEGGPRLAYSFLREGLIDKFVFYISPKIFGDGLSLFVGGFESPKIERSLRIESVERIGPDIRVVCYP